MYVQIVKRHDYTFLMTGTLYARIAKQLAQAIASGQYPLGSFLPTEMALAEQYQASRQTVRAALKELQDLGLVSRRKRVGTRVEAASAEAGFSQSIASWEDLTQITEHEERLIHSVTPVVADKQLALELGCAPGRRWLRIDVLRQGVTGKPVGWTQAYLDVTYDEVPNLLRESPKALISSLIEKHYGRRVAEVVQTVQAAAIPAHLADTLQASVSSPALKIIRRYLDQANEAFEITVGLYPADRLVLCTRLRRERG